MIPDAATIARRRHFVTMIVRFLIVAYAVWCCYLFATSTLRSLILTPLWADYGVLNTLRNEWPVAAGDLMRLVILVLAIVLESRLVRWIVPIPGRHPGCPKCGYSLKDLNSPICPECGTSLRG